MSASASRSSSISQGQQPYPFYQQDAVRVFVQQQSGDGEGGLSGPTTRRFSVDPQLTSFDILRNLIGRAFDVKRDFTISYRAFDDYGGETFLPMVSDWDLSAAFLSASDPDLQLMIEPKIDCDDEEAWELIRSTDLIPPNDASPQQQLSNKPNSRNSSFVINHNHHNNHQQNYEGVREESNYRPSSGVQANNASPSTNTGNNYYPNYNHQGPNNGAGGVGGSTKVFSSAMSQISGAVNQYHPISLNSKINTAGIFNTMEKWVQKAKTFVEDISVVTSRPPLSDIEFRNYLDAGGVLCRPRELRYACYHGGIEPGLRKVVWKHLLNVYPEGLSGNGRMEYIRSKSKEYYELRDLWKSAVQNGQVSEDILYVSNMVRKDVLRTDRHLQFFAGQDDNQNIAILFNVLTTYALNHPSVGYCQGMSDLASPLLVTIGDEAQAYICFCSLMDRLKPNFNCDGLAMSLKFAHLSETLAHYDSYFWAYLKSIGADDLLFCYRWLLLEMKREFAFEDALRMMEVLWASLPYKPQDVPLFEVKFTLSNSHSIPIPVPTLTASYSRVCAIRRSSTSVGSNEIRQRRLSRKPKASPFSLDETSLTSMSSIASSYRSHAKPFYSLDETMEIISSSDFLSTSPFEILSLNNGSTPPSKPKLVKNLKEFWTIGKSKLELAGGSDPSRRESGDSTSFSANSSKSSTVSNFEALQNLTDADVNGQVFFDDPTSESGSEANTLPHPFLQSSSITEQLRQSFQQFPGKPRARLTSSSCPSTQNNVDSLSTSTSTTTAPNNLQTSFNHNHQSSPNLMSENEKSESEKENINSGGSPSIATGQHESEDGTAKKQHFLHPGANPDAERQSQISTGGGSEHDSGHCYNESMEMFENSLQEPEFQLGVNRQPTKMPSPELLGGGNPFLMFLCLTLLLQHRDHIIRNRMDYNETAMYFDKMIRKHNVGRVLAHARMLYSEYLKKNVARA